MAGFELLLDGDADDALLNETPSEPIEWRDCAEATISSDSLIEYCGVPLIVVCLMLGRDKFAALVDHTTLLHGWFGINNCARPAKHHY